MQTGESEVRGVQEEAEVSAPAEAGSYPDTGSTEATETTTEAPEGPADESIRETVARALEAEKAKLTGDEGAPTPEQAQKPELQVEKAPKKKKDGPFDPEMFPPERLRAGEKELFNKLPLPLKKAWHRAIKDLEAVTTRDAQRYSQAIAESRGIMEAVQPFATSWASKGFTVPQAVVSLAAAQEKLINESTRMDAYMALGRDLGIDFEQAAAISRGEAPEGPVTRKMTLEQDPSYISLRDEVNALKLEREQARSQQLESTVQTIVAELASVRDEKDSFGRYRYPEMHEEGFFEKVKPLVSALRGTVPGLSHGDALRRAYSMMTGKSEGASAQVNQSSLPPQGNTNERALAAAVSVRGRTAPQINGTLMPDKIPDSVRETTRMALEQLRRG